MSPKSSGFFRALHAKAKCDRGVRPLSQNKLGVESLENRQLLAIVAADWDHRVDVVEPAAQPALLNARPAGEFMATVRHELVIVDTAVPNYAQLVGDLVSQASADRQFETVLVDGKTDGVAEVGRILGQRQGLDAVHVISHGHSGAVDLGTSEISTETLPKYADSIKDWAAALKPGADVLIYGCDVAAGPQGQSLVRELKKLTGADIAASVDATGNALLGGDWNLEYQVGSIETAVAPSASAQRNWRGVLAAQLQDNGLKIEAIAAPNLVVDSNVETPASYSPRAAYLGVKVSNTGVTTLTNVVVKIGDLTNPATGAGTPGIYPTTTVASPYSGTFSLTHEGGAPDATRIIPSLAPGKSVTVYWLVSYPLTDASNKTVTGAANVTTDDLVLNYDIWAQATDGGSTVPLSEISNLIAA